MAKTEKIIGFRVSEELKMRIEEQAKKEKRTVSNFIVKVVSDYLDQVEQEER